MDVQVKGTSIECSFKRQLVLDTWLSIKNSRTEVERQRLVFQALNQLLPDVENLITDDLEKRVNYLCTRFVALWNQFSRNRSRLVTNKNNKEWLDETEVCVLSTCTAAGSQDTQQQRSSAKVSTSTQPHQHRKSFGECSKKSKRRRLAELSKLDSSAISSLLDDSSRSSAAASLSFDTNEVLSLFNETKLTKHQYILVLIHGSEVIEHSLLSIGELSEEAAESSNKLVKQFRRDNTRKMSRVATNTDLIHRLLLNSDPYISGLRKLPRKKKSMLSKEVLNLLSN